MALSKKTKLAGSATVMVAAVALALIFNRPESAAATQSTDDAYIRAEITSVAPEITGLVEAVLVEENQPVRAGQLLVQIDDREYVLAERNAAAALAHARAAADGIHAQIEVQQSVIRQAQSTIEADQATRELARLDYNRYKSLAADGSGTVQARQQAKARLQVEEAQQTKDQAILQAQKGRQAALQADLLRAQAEIRQAEAALAQARLDLSRTRITAPIAGTIGHKRVRVGNYARTGDPLLTLVPLTDIYIEANFRETQLARMRQGQPVRVTVDALPGRTFTGTVQSLGPASGVSYSVIAPHNATGNFTKIVQRLPVRIALDPQQDGANQLRVGMSVQPEVDVNAR